MVSIYIYSSRQSGAARERLGSSKTLKAVIQAHRPNSSEAGHLRARQECCMNQSAVRKKTQIHRRLNKQREEITPEGRCADGGPSFNILLEQILFQGNLFSSRLFVNDAFFFNASMESKCFSGYWVSFWCYGRVHGLISLILSKPRWLHLNRKEVESLIL